MQNPPAFHFCITDLHNREICENLCKDFHDSAYNDAFILYQATDKLNAIFMNDSIAINSIRKKGFSLIERSPALKKFITNYAMGI